MAKISKRVKKIKTIEFPTSPVSPAEALDLIDKYSKLAKVKFDESIDVGFHLTLEPGKNVNSSTVLPHGNGKKQKVIAFVDDSEVKACLEAGATKAGLDSLIEEIVGGFADFDKCVASQAVLPTVSKKLAKILGPKGLLPSIKSGTVGADPVAILKNVLGGQVSFKSSKTGSLSASVARVSFSKEKILQNISAFISAVKTCKPAGAKSYIKSVSISTTMGPGIKINPNNA